MPVWLTVTPSENDFCDGCYFEHRNDCPTLYPPNAQMECSRGSREDNNDVIFKLTETTNKRKQ